MTFSPTRTGTAESQRPAKHLRVFGSSWASTSTRFCSSRHAAHDLFVVAISAQNGFSFFTPCSGRSRVSSARKARGNPVVSLNAFW